MRMFIYILTLVITTSFASSAQATDRVACATRSVLEVVIEQGVPVDGLGNPTVDCTMLSSSFVSNELTSAKRTIVVGHSIACGGPHEFCVIWIVKATYQGITFYYEVGFYESIPADQFEESVAGVADLGGPFLPYGIPGGFGLPTPPTTTGEKMLAEVDELKGVK